MEISKPHQVINIKYHKAKVEFSDCIETQFEKFKRDHIAFDKFINSPTINEICKSERNDLLKLIDDGIFDYGEFNKSS
jgi:hypothetical protein